MKIVCQWIDALCNGCRWGEGLWYLAMVRYRGLTAFRLCGISDVGKALKIRFPNDLLILDIPSSSFYK